MRRVVIQFVALLGLLVTAVGCTDVPTGVAAERGRRIAAEDAGISGSIFLEPVIVRGCDPTITECEDDAGWNSCASSDQGPWSPEMGTIEGCSGGGGTGPGGDGGIGDGGGSGTTPSDPMCPSTGCEEPTAYEEGPLAWGACVLAVLGSTYSIYQVAGAFEEWWDTQREYDSAKRTYDAMLANPESVTPEMMELWRFRVEYARNRNDAAISSVSEKTGGSYWALGGAAVACGVAAFLPTP
jgi:hypothetical protein